MFRALLLAIVFIVIPRATSSQAPSVLHIKIVLTDAQQKATPVARHALLISENPTSRSRSRAKPTTGRRWWMSPPAATRSSS